MIWHFPATHPMSPLGISEYVDHHSDQQWPLHQTVDIGMWLLYRVLILVWSLQCDVLVSAALQHVASDITLTWIRLNAKNGLVSPVLNTVCRTWGHGHMSWAAKLKSSQWKVKLYRHFPCHVVFLLPPSPVSFSDYLPLLQTGTGDGGADLCLVSAVPSRAAWQPRDTWHVTWQHRTHLTPIHHTGDICHH